MTDGQDVARHDFYTLHAVAGHKKDLLRLIGAEVAGVVDGVLDRYGGHTGGEQTLMTHRGDTLWKAAYRPGSNKAIPTTTMARFYRRQAGHGGR